MENLKALPGGRQKPQPFAFPPPACPPAPPHPFAPLSARRLFLEPLLFLPIGSSVPFKNQPFYIRQDRAARARAPCTPTVWQREMRRDEREPVPRASPPRRPSPLLTSPGASSGASATGAPRPYRGSLSHTHTTTQCACARACALCPLPPLPQSPSSKSRKLLFYPPPAGPARGPLPPLQISQLHNPPRAAQP